MTPRTDHRFFLPLHGLAFEASWRRPARTRSDRIRDRLVDLMFGGPVPGTPEDTVRPEAFLSALDLLDQQDVDGATRAFTDLGYDVRVRTLAAS